MLSSCWRRDSRDPKNRGGVRDVWNEMEEGIVFERLYGMRFGMHVREM